MSRDRIFQSRIQLLSKPSEDDELVQLTGPVLTAPASPTYSSDDNFDYGTTHTIQPLSKALLSSLVAKSPAAVPNTDNQERNALQTTTSSGIVNTFYNIVNTLKSFFWTSPQESSSKDKVCYHMYQSFSVHHSPFDYFNIGQLIISLTIFRRITLVCRR